MRYVPSKKQVRERLTSAEAWQLPKQKSALAPAHVWTNEDMDPAKIENQTWTLWTWIAYWATDVFNLGTWQTASAILSVGLSWREAIPIVRFEECKVMGAELMITDCGWNVLCCYSHGLEWCYWCKASHPILRRHPGFVWILFRILCYCVSYETRQGMKLLLTVIA
jgi:cytosine/uracil/thiamine/allantoin permease